MPSVPELGRRGGGWVVLQFVLMAAIVVAVVLAPSWPESAQRALSLVGAVLAVAGGTTAFAASRSLGPSLTPYPRPGEPASLVERGPYRLVRHPMYLGGVLFFAGLSLAFSPWALAGTIVLGAVWALKSSVEERFLVERYPGYEAYCRRTRFRLLPFVY